METAKTAKVKVKQKQILTDFIVSVKYTSKFEVSSILDKIGGYDVEYERGEQDEAMMVMMVSSCSPVSYST